MFRKSEEPIEKKSTIFIPYYHTNIAIEASSRLLYQHLGEIRIIQQALWWKEVVYRFGVVAGRMAKPLQEMRQPCGKILLPFQGH